MALFDRKGRPTKRLLEQRQYGFGNVFLDVLRQNVRGDVDGGKSADFAIRWLADSGTRGQLPVGLESRHEAFIYAKQRLNELWDHREVEVTVSDLEAYLLNAFAGEPPIMQAGGPITLYTMALFYAFTAEVVADHFASLGPQRRESVVDQTARAIVSLGFRYRESL